MSLEFLKTTCKDGAFTVTDLRMDQVVSTGLLDGKRVLACSDHIDGACVVILEDDERTYAALTDVNRDLWWIRPDDGVRFFGIDHPHEPVAFRLADGRQEWFTYETGEPTNDRARIVDGCCCS